MTPLPILRYQGEGFRIGTDGASVDLFNTRDLRFEGALLPRFSAFDGPGSPELAGIDRNITNDLGLRMSYGLGEALQFEATLLQEITGEHDGQEIILGLEQGVQIGNMPVAFGAGVSWKSDDLSNYIYGVSTSEAIAGRPGPVALSCHSKCSFKPPFVQKRQGFSSRVLNGGVVDCKTR